MKEQLTSRRAAVLAALAFAVGAAVLAFWRTSAEWGEPANAQRFSHDTLELVTAAGVRKIDIELAVTPSEQAQGLMFRTGLADTHGMLFLHPAPGEIRMWMHNTYIPLDMIFIRADGTVHRIAARTEPMSDAVIASHGEVTAVLELNGGAAERLGLKVGDTVRHAHFKAAKP
jgi:hypothetical protein